MARVVALNGILDQAYGQGALTAHLAFPAAAVVVKTVQPAYPVAATGHAEAAHRAP